MSSKKQRPLSPHLGIYRPQISSVLSIFHRVASVISLIGLLFGVFWLCYIVYAPYQDQQGLWQLFSTVPIKLLVILWTYPFVYYICTEVRYLFWGFGKGFEIKTFELSGYAAVFISLLIWGVFWIAALV